MKPIIMAHRGASKFALENTLPAFQKAIDCKSDYIELDVRVCKSEDLIVFHDKTGKRLLGKRWSIAKMSLEKIKKISLPNGENIPTLSEALAFIKDQTKINIEIKITKAKQEILQDLVSTIRKYNLSEHVMVSSFCHPFLKELKKMEPEIKTAALFIRKRDVHGYMRKSKFSESIVKKAKSVEADAINIKHNFVTKKLIRLAHETNITINAWTVDTFKVAKKMFRLGIDGIITNKPKTFVKLINGEEVNSKQL